MTRTVSLERQIRCVKRELSLRERVYRHRVDLGKMTQATADDETRTMRAVLAELERVLWLETPVRPLV